MKLSAARKAGAEAHAAGLSVEDCPFPDGTQHEHNWKKEWHRANGSWHPKPCEPKPVEYRGQRFVSMTQAKAALGRDRRWKDVKEELRYE